MTTPTPQVPATGADIHGCVWTWHGLRCALLSPHRSPHHIVGEQPAFAKIEAQIEAEARQAAAVRVDYEEMRKDRGWPTPMHMYRCAEALDILTPARYGDVLRWVADLCDGALNQPPPADQGGQ